MNRGRPKKVRYIQNMPRVVQFSPRGRPGRPDEVDLTLDEFEAIKLADYQDFDQIDGAKVMCISRPSFGRILRGARKKIADAVVNGKIIKIHLGDVQVGVRKKDFSKESFEKEIEGWQARNRIVSKQINEITGQKEISE